MASAEELESQIESAEEAGDVAQLLDIIGNCTSHGGNEDWAEVTEAALDGVFRLSKGGQVDKSLTESALSATFSALEAWKEEDAIVEVALGCIVALVKHYENNESDSVVAAKDWNVNLLWSLLQDFEDESTIQEQACLAIEGMALASDKWKDLLKASDSCPGELVAAKERINNERNKAYPGRAADALGVSME